MRGDVGYFVQIALKSLGNLQRLGPEGILSFEQQKRLLPFRKHTLEFERGLRGGVLGHDQTLDRRVGGNSCRTVDASHGEDAKERDYPTPRLQHAQEEPHEARGSRHVHTGGTLNSTLWALGA